MPVAIRAGDGAEVADISSWAALVIPLKGYRSRLLPAGRPQNADTPCPCAIPLIIFWEGARGEASPAAAHREQPHAGRTAGRVAPGCTPSGA